MAGIETGYIELKQPLTNFVRHKLNWTLISGANSTNG